MRAVAVPTGPVAAVLGAALRAVVVVEQRGDVLVDPQDHRSSGAAVATVGAAERLIKESLAYALERKQFGEPLAEKQLIQAMLADSKAEAFAARCMIEETARRRDAGQDVSTDAACCKMFASEMVGRVADRAVQIHGGAGYMSEYPVERFYRDVRLFRIYEGTTQIQQLIIARNMIKEAAF